MASDKPRLFYFDITGRAHLIRLLLTYTGTEFEDVRFSGEEWATKYKAEAPLGMAPYYEEGGVKFGGSLAIARYVGEKYGLGGSNPLENAQLSSYVDALGDVGDKLCNVMWGPEDKREECKAEFLKKIPLVFSSLEEQIKGEDSFLIGKSTWADVMLYNLCAFLTNVEFPEVFNHCNKVKATFSKISADEKIKAFNAEHPPQPKV